MDTSQKPSRCSVILANVFKTHMGRTIFDGINFTAFSGKICAVLGGIESGKSMLLSCIVGGNDFDSGQMWVLGGKPQTKSSKTLTKHVGYMPQEFCLYEKMTVLELILYFGQLYDINSKFILWRLRYYNDFFTFPSSKSLVKDLSYSEKRIVSFIITVFHRPRLIVLDEPTTGLDTSKKNQVWSYIHHMIHTWKPTIIVATNNVEEASLATNIVYLKDGKIIFDHDVSDLKKNHPNQSLEHIVDILHTKRNEWLHSNESKMPHDKVLTNVETLTPRTSIWKLKTVTIKNIRVLLRSRWFFLIMYMN
ncbi:ABC transporter G family member 23-like [Adelges cooleyi]|uniref:ABC transporter G family member 23-like n=1 Tax=Adelges cooleyi TaxID=133065 RepID=UPI00217FC19B|nr:ABC transporter G family member 23-like [Adelges cooleyi]